MVDRTAVEEGGGSVNRGQRIAIVLGAFTAIASIWLGAYAMHVLPSWAHFPAFATAFLGVVSGIVIAASALGALD